MSVSESVSFQLGSFVVVLLREVAFGCCGFSFLCVEGVDPCDVGHVDQGNKDHDCGERRRAESQKLVS